MNEMYKLISGVIALCLVLFISFSFAQKCEIASDCPNSNYTCQEGSCVMQSLPGFVISETPAPTESPKQQTTVVIPQPIIGTTCEDAEDGAIVTNPLTKAKTKYEDFAADGQKVKYDCKDGNLVETRSEFVAAYEKRHAGGLFPGKATGKVAFSVSAGLVVGNLAAAAQPAFIIDVLFFTNSACTDSDKGNIFEKGFVSDKGKTYADICKDDKFGFNRTLMEQNCVASGLFGKPRARTEEVDCLGQFNAQCYDGRCALFEPTSECWDSDGSGPIAQQAIVEGWVIPAGSDTAIPVECRREKKTGPDEVVLHEKVCGDDKSLVYEQRVDCDSLGASRRCINYTISGGRLLGARCTDGFADNNKPRSK